MTDQCQRGQTGAKATLPTVSVTDDDPNLRVFFKDLADAGHFILLDAYANGGDTLAKLPRNPPDIAFMDVRLPDLSGIECTKRLTTILPRLRVIVLTGNPEPSTLLEALRAGAAGVLLKPCSIDETLASINDVMNEGVTLGKTALPYLRSMIRHLRHRDAKWNLTERQEQLIACIFEGLSYKEIAAKLKIGQSTVHTHMDHLFDKLGVSSQEEVIAKFLQP